MSFYPFKIVPLTSYILNLFHPDNLYGTLFFKIKCRLLKISDTPIVTINEHIFHGINRTLQELHITNSSIAEFPKIPFKVLNEQENFISNSINPPFF